MTGISMVDPVHLADPMHVPVESIAAISSPTAMAVPFIVGVHRIPTPLTVTDMLVELMV